MLPAIYLRTSLTWSDLESMPKAELTDLIEALTVEVEGGGSYGE